MAVIKELHYGECTVIVHDDCIVKTQEEVDEILDNVKKIAEGIIARTAS